MEFECDFCAKREPCRDKKMAWMNELVTFQEWTLCHNVQKILHIGMLGVSWVIAHCGAQILLPILFSLCFVLVFVWSATKQKVLGLNFNWIKFKYWNTVVVQAISTLNGLWHPSTSVSAIMSYFVFLCKGCLEFLCKPHLSTNFDSKKHFDRFHISSWLLPCKYSSAKRTISH